MENLDDLRVPMRAVDAAIVAIDGGSLRGRFFLPVQSARHAGRMLASERFNETIAFLPFLLEGQQRSILVNKRTLIVVSVAASEDRDGSEDGLEPPLRRVMVDCAGRHWEGDVVLDMPNNQRRVLDYLNRPDEFLVLRDGDLHHLMQKSHVARVTELDVGREGA